MKRASLDTIAFLGTVCLAITAAAQTSAPPNGEAATATDWPLFRGNQALTGIAHGRLPDELKLRWKFQTDGPIRSSPVVRGDRAWIGSDDGHVYAVDLHSGDEIWSYKTEGPVEAPPALVNGLVVVGSDDGHLYALNADTGVLRWKYRTDDKIVGTANWARLTDTGRICILVGSYDNRLHCVDAADGKPLWQYDTDNFINGGVAVNQGKAVFGGCDGLLHVVRVSDGKGLAKVEIGSYVAASAALAGDRAYVGHYDHKLISVDLKHQTVSWEYHDRDFAFFSSAAVSSDHVVLGGRDKRLHCVRRDSGKPLWTFQTRGRVDSSPVICDGKVIVGSDDGRLYVVRLADGSEVWSYEIGDTITGSPAVVLGMVLIGAEDGRLYAFAGE